MPWTYRRIRLVCVSDTHNSSPANGCFKLPKGDILIHAGDLTNQGTIAELQKTVKWIDEADFEAKIVIAGNHDITLDADFYRQHGSHFHNQHPQNIDDCIQLLRNSSSITYLNHESADIHLSNKEGPATTLKIFGSPFSPAHGLWAFGYQPEAAAELWDGIPLDTDVVITHTPPKYHCDESNIRGSIGCENLRQRLWCVRPQLAVCGHVHEGRGAELVRWDLTTPNIMYKEETTRRWVDPGGGNKKQSLLDLSARRPDRNRGAGAQTQGLEPKDGSQRALTPNFQCLPMPETPDLAAIPDVHEETRNLPSSSIGKFGVPGTTTTPLNKTNISHAPNDPGGKGFSKTGRRETCVVNAAIMASSWPHASGITGKKYNKPIIVDMDVPEWRDGTEE